MQQMKLFDKLKIPPHRQAKRLLPEIPKTGWKLPELPNIHEKILSIDTETYDPELLSHGPGWSRGKGHLVGFSIATLDNRAWYFPLRHSLPNDLNLDIDHTLSWLRDVLKRCQVLVGANLLYDLGWLAEDNVVVDRTVRTLDVQYAQALLNERSPVNLDFLAEYYLGMKKVTSKLYEWIQRAYGTKNDPRAEIWRSPATLVGPYAEADAYLPLRLMNPLSDQLNTLGLMDLFLLECRLIPLLLKMRQEGVAIDLSAVERFKELIENKIDTENHLLKNEVGFEVNVNAPSDLMRVFTTEELKKLPETGKTGRPSFAEAALKKLNTNISKKVLRIRHLVKIKDTFINGHILGNVVNGKIHCQFHPLRGESGGTKTGRFSSSNPNLQQIPARDVELSPLVRGCFVADSGHEQIRTFDYSSIEFRMFAHYAQSERLVKAYQEPDADFHAIVGQMLGGNLPRKLVKTFSFSILYGGGVHKIAEMLRNSMSEEEAKKIYEKI